MKPDVCAPGQNVNSTTLGGGYSGDTWSGTSMATPHVAGTVALMLSGDPGLSPTEIKSILEDTAIELGPAGKDSLYGSGRIDALEAVLAAYLPPDVTITLVPDVTAVPQGGSFGIEITLENQTGSAQTFQGWTLARRGSTWYGPLRGPVFVTLDPYEVFVHNVTEHVPSSAPIDEYTYIGRIGCYPGPAMDEDSFEIQVTAP
jgi:hypothetical protein